MIIKPRDGWFLKILLTKFLPNFTLFLKNTKTQIDKIIAYQTAAENAQKCRWLNLKTHNGTMSTEEFNKKFPTLTKDIPFDDFIYYSSW